MVVSRPKRVTNAPGHQVVTEAESAAPADDAIAQVGRNVAALRRLHDLTLATLADRTALSTAYISQIESGLANPTLKTIVQLANGLGVATGALFGSMPARVRPFEPRFAPLPVVAREPGGEGIWNLSAAGSAALAARLVRGAAGDHARPISHSGEEFIAVLAGSCQLWLDSAMHEMRAGDCCHLHAEDVHYLEQPSDDLLLVVVMTES